MRRMLLLTMSLALAVAALPAFAGAVDGTWRLDAAASQNLEDAAEAFNEALNEKERDRPQEFEHSSSKRGGGRFQAQADATARMIAEDNRSRRWGGPPEVREMLHAEVLRLYQQRKVVVLYDATRKRLLRINPAGRAFSVSGTETTEDDIGRSLSWLDGDALVVETDVYDGSQLVEHFAVDDSGERLIVSIRQRERRGGPWLEFERQFTRVE